MAEARATRAGAGSARAASAATSAASANNLGELLSNYLTDVVLEEDDDDPFETEPRAKRSKTSSPTVQLSMYRFLQPTDDASLTVVAGKA